MSWPGQSGRSNPESRRSPRKRSGPGGGTVRGRGGHDEEDDEGSSLSGPEYYPPMGRRVDAGKRSTILRREGLPFPASAARTVEGPLAVGGDKNEGVGVGRTPFPDPPRGSRPLAGFHGRQDLASRQVEPGGEEERPPGGTRRQAVLAAKKDRPSSSRLENSAPEPTRGMPQSPPPHGTNPWGNVSAARSSPWKCPVYPSLETCADGGQRLLPNRKTNGEDT